MRIHGGADVPWDFSTNANALGPCPVALQAVLQADRQRYPDARYTALIEALAQWHGVAPDRVLLGGSASELIMRLHIALRLLCADHALRVAVPQPAYGDYADSALACGHEVIEPSYSKPVDVQWHTLPSSPLGQGLLGEVLTQQLMPRTAVHVIDAAYQPLLLEGPCLPKSASDTAWSLWTPNKALGLCGVRGAYAISPAVGSPRWQALADQMRQLEPSWVLGAEGQAMLLAWVSESVQAWLADSLASLRKLKAKQLVLLESLRLAYQPSVTNFFVAQLSPDPVQQAKLFHALLAKGVALRDTSSMGLPGWARMRVHTDAAQSAFLSAWKSIK
ncbi:aminotransferase class I/II-fold pyridoxal phosphate-dependent enzyme [Variovorax sp. PCZ-1]|uniref:aminotransferase class I/II-fold pyridoxal phosphate-dependent enzyme n=1 Tax=Variovorax sp. PCZ-1 TaxID=2835533 RepID=UPI001BCE82C6|nr:aminotransferase class I/II-fold pyridoxal phosphate-dependent enzyme [Variovorax sp. PCZ-1]MBS7807009.1 aminotransferase class I/II-fold pyridoxal phosphate-dependent enzyme [Variovorax sp. PCZ-1]